MITDTMITAQINSCITQLNDIKRILINITELSLNLDDEECWRIEDSIWSLCDATDDLKVLIKDER